MESIWKILLLQIEPNDINVNHHSLLDMEYVYIFIYHMMKGTYGYFLYFFFLQLVIVIWSYLRKYLQLT